LGLVTGDRVLSDVIVGTDGAVSVVSYPDDPDIVAIFAQVFLDLPEIEPSP
jgi:hypothetical protein